MQLAQVDVAPSPAMPGFVRLTVVFAVERSRQPLTYWFEVPAEYRDELASSADPWIVLMLPIAVSLGEPIRTYLPVDQLLLENLTGIQRIWKSWYPYLDCVPIEAPTRTTPAAPSGGPGRRRRSAAFFSGGIDSFFTLLRHNGAALGQGSKSVDDLLSIAGFNSPPATVEAMRRRLEPIAERFGKRFIPIVTNLRYSAQPVATPYSNPEDMIYLAHGAALAGVAHLFGDRYDEVIIPGSDDYTNLEPYGSHPITDPLFSSRTLHLVQDGASLTRVERTAAVVQSNEPLGFLHVCWQDWSLGNCSLCLKCLYTMATLDILGAAERATSFDWTRYDGARLSSMWIRGRTERAEFFRLIEESDRRGRPEIAAAVLKSIGSSRRREAVLRLIDSNPVTRESWKAIRRLRSRRLPAIGGVRGASAPSSTDG